MSRMFRIHGALLAAALLAGLVAVAPDGALAQEKKKGGTYQEMIADSEKVLETFLASGRWDGVVNLMGGARGVYIAPLQTRRSFIIGAEDADGVLLRRYGRDWSDPVFMELDKATIGFQAGATNSKLVMVIMTDKAATDLAEGVDKLGGTGGIALGNVGAAASGGGDKSGGVEMLMVEISAGAYIGSGIASMEMASRVDLNSAAYGEDFKLTEILSRPGGNLAAAEQLRKLLGEITEKAWDIR